MIFKVLRFLAGKFTIRSQANKDILILSLRNSECADYYIFEL